MLSFSLTSCFSSDDEDDVIVNNMQENPTEDPIENYNYFDGTYRYHKMLFFDANEVERWGYVYNNTWDCFRYSRLEFTQNGDNNLIDKPYVKLPDSHDCNLSPMGLEFWEDNQLIHIANYFQDEDGDYRFLLSNGRYTSKLYFSFIDIPGQGNQLPYISFSYYPENYHHNDWTITEIRFSLFKVG